MDYVMAPVCRGADSHLFEAWFRHQSSPFPRMRLAFALIFAADAGESFPFETIWVALAFALAA
jgi:hypothetical protein